MVFRGSHNNLVNKTGILRVIFTDIKQLSHE